MAIPVTTVASESVFSTGGRVISPHRSRLAPKTVEGLMCMQAWSRADMLGDKSCFINALMTCLEDEEDEMVRTNTYSLVIFYCYICLLNINMDLSIFTLFTVRMILIV
jgi:hypothetical protein